MRRPLSEPEFCTWGMDDGYSLRGRVWRPTGAVRGIVLYLHGIQSHGGWFEWSASVLADAGAWVVLADRRGSGLNAEARGDVSGSTRWLADVDALAQWALATAGAARVHVIGVSWGGKLALCWALRRPEAAGQLLVVAPGIRPQVGVTLSERIRILGARVVSPKALFRIPLEQSSLFTRDTAGRQFIEQDPLKLERATARFLVASAGLDWRLRRARFGALRSAALLVLAERDLIINNEKTEREFRRVAGERGRVTQIADADHSLEFEPAEGRYRSILQSWANEALNSS